MTWEDRPEKVGKFTILDRLIVRLGGGIGWRVKCDCGIVTIARERDLKAGTANQCYKCGKDALVKRVTKHGRSRHSLYRLWLELKARDLLCLEWLDLARFIADIGSLHGDTLCRLDKSKPFGPDNWTTKERLSLPLTASEAEAIKTSTGQERRRLARLARARGATYTAIGKALGVSRVTARDIVHVKAHGERIRKIKGRIASYTRRLERMNRRLWEFEMLEKADKARLLAQEQSLKAEPVFRDPASAREDRALETPEAPR